MPSACFQFQRRVCYMIWSTRTDTNIHKIAHSHGGCMTFLCTLDRASFSTPVRTKQFLLVLCFFSFIHSFICAEWNVKRIWTTVSHKSIQCSSDNAFARSHTHCSFDWLKSHIMWYWLYSGESVMKCVRFYFLFIFRMCMFTSFLCMFFSSSSSPGCYVVCFYRLFSVFFFSVSLFLALFFASLSSNAFAHHSFPMLLLV